MRIFVFASETRRGLHAFAGDKSGTRLPLQVGPWRLLFGSAPGNNLPHSIPRKPIERAILTDGFQMWRMKVAAPKSDDDEAEAAEEDQEADAAEEEEEEAD